MTKFCRIMVICVFTFSFAVAAQAATFVVNTTADTLDATPGDGNCADAGGSCSLRAAISEANALAGDDIITLGAVEYTQSLVAANEDLNAGGDWDVTSVITINGAGQASTFLQANAASGVATERVINVRAGGNLTMTNLTVRHGRFTGTMLASMRGAGIENNAILTLNNVTVRDNVMNSTSGNPIGAGIHNAGSSVTLTNSTITANTNTRVTGGSAFGGGMSSITAVNLTITNSSISGNTAQSLAGGFGFGAGLYLENLFTVNATGSNFNNNTGSGTSGSNGVGVRALSNIGAATFNVTNCTFNGNTGTVVGAGLNQGTGVQIFTTTAAAATLTATFDGTSISGNSGNSIGVGMNATVSTGGNMSVTVRNSTISGNSAASNGGGMSISNTGGTANSTGTFNFLNSTISGNTANGNGGGLFFEQPAAGALTVNVNYTTIANNRANNDNAGTEGGGGIFHAATGTLNMKNSVVGDNTLGAGTNGPDVAGGVNSQDYNHIEDTTGATIGGTTTNNATGDAVLGPLANNGGPTLTHHPGVGSPVLNTIPNATNDCGSPVATDQRGTARPNGAGCEKGSVETATAASPATIAGQVLTSDGRGIRNVTVTLSGGGLPSPLVVQTGNFGSFAFTGILTGQTYTLSVAAKRYTFTTPSRNINLTGDSLNENFTADPGLGARPEGVKESEIQ